MKWIRAILLLALLHPAGLDAQVAQPSGQRDGRRAELEARIYDRFIERTSAELGLDAEASRQLRQIVLESAAHRRDLAREGGRIRQALARAVRDSTTSDAELGHLLAAVDSLRTRELGVWREEQRALAEALTPRQHAQFVGLRSRFNARLIELRNRIRLGRWLRPPGGAPR